MEFKVGDRVRIRENLSECEEYSGTFVVSPMLDCRGQIATIEAQNDDRYLIDLDNHHWDWTKEMFEPIKNQDQQKIEELEKRIEKLEKCANLTQNTLEKSANVSNMQNNEQNKQNNSQICEKITKNEEIISKQQLLTEDERVILRNMNKDFKWIFRDIFNNLIIQKKKPKRVKHRNNEFILEGVYVPLYCYKHLFKFIKFEDEPSNIEELLKGEE